MLVPDDSTAAAECISEDALVHLKSYKYSSVDKSLISNYILKHYVCNAESMRGSFMLISFQIVEWSGQAASNVARAKHGDAAGVLLYLGASDILGYLDA